MNIFPLTITTPDGTLYHDAVEKVTLATNQGQITILPHHIPLVTDIVPGEALITQNGVETPFALYGGFVEVRRGGEVAVLADAGERPEEIDIEAAEQARERAQKALAVKFDPADYEDAALTLERELARVRIARKHRSRIRHAPEQSQ